MKGELPRIVSRSAASHSANGRDSEERQNGRCWPETKRKPALGAGCGRPRLCRHDCPCQGADSATARARFPDRGIAASAAGDRARSARSGFVQDRAAEAGRWLRIRLCRAGRLRRCDRAGRRVGGLEFRQSREPSLDAGHVRQARSGSGLEQGRQRPDCILLHFSSRPRQESRWRICAAWQLAILVGRRFLRMEYACQRCFLRRRGRRDRVPDLSAQQKRLQDPRHLERDRIARNRIERRRGQGCLCCRVR